MRGGEPACELFSGSGPAICLLRSNLQNGTALLRPSGPSLFSELRQQVQILHSYSDACLTLPPEAVSESERHFFDTSDVSSHKNFQKNFEALRLKGDVTNCISPDKKETRH